MQYSSHKLEYATFRITYDRKIANEIMEYEKNKTPSSVNMAMTSAHMMAKED